MKCEICSGETQTFGEAIVLGKYPAQYIRCLQCGYIQPLNPIWLDEAYSDAITRSDIGMISRNQYMQPVTEALIHLCFDRRGKFVDYGGGYGVFVRMMRDRGFDFYRQDLFCENMFAKGFDAGDKLHQTCELVTAFEVFEHFVNPIEEIPKILRYSCNILISTTVVPDPVPDLNNWWYYGLEHGQHVSLYTLESLKQIAKRMNLYLVSNGSTMHLLSEKQISPSIFTFAMGVRAASMANLFLRRFMTPRSLLQSDYYALTGKRQS